MITQQSLVEFLDRFFNVDRYPEEERGGIYQLSDRPIRRLGLALEPIPQIDYWITKNQIDALFLHRPWQFNSDLDIGIVFYHLAFDERLTLGFNLQLADVLSLVNVQPFGYKADRAIGMIGEVPSQSFERYCVQVREIFGGYESANTYSCSEANGQTDTTGKVAIVGSMNDGLIRSAAEQGATVYITGQFRVSAKQAVLDTGMGVIEVGHRRCEQWGLRTLSAVLRQRWSALRTIVIS
ncbi:Nif3-like dinuclear metal center hexameric protein [Leptolyngbya sp. DQ-M1]|uniref:Nif3-like dinuclear metal center hexameric protein n=1 Tax=Leptolyngbya sp. DQ-M1 TaxID=2933920 RepID=UPI00329A5DCD